MSSPLWLAALAGVLLFGSSVGFLLGRGRERARRRREVAEARDESSRLLGRAREESENLRTAAVLKGREEALHLREEWEREEARRRGEIEQTEKKLGARSEALDQKFDAIAARDAEHERLTREVRQQQERLEGREKEAAESLERARRRLETAAGMTAVEAKAQLVSEIEDEARSEAANTVREVREEAQRAGAREAKQVIALAIQRMAAEETAHATVSVVQLPSDDMKGRIIGREGRNIRAFEQATGIDVIIDDTPEAIVLSGFDPVRREVARIAMEKLIEDGRIHPGRIEEIVVRSQAEVEAGMLEAAEQATYDLGIRQLHPEIMKVLGRLKFRTSYGQNQLTHSREVARLAGAMATEMGLDAAICKRAGLLHDIGKGLTHDHEGTHVELGYELCRKCREHPVVLNSIKAHHDEEPHATAEAFLVTAADAISGSRPGARREMFDTYVKRLEKLEKIAMEFAGVERCFAIQAGREVRVMVQPEKVTDAEMATISEKVARRFEEDLQYPGQIKVVVIRETRAVDFAR